MNFLTLLETEIEQDCEQFLVLSEELAKFDKEFYLTKMSIDMQIEYSMQMGDFINRLDSAVMELKAKIKAHQSYQEVKGFPVNMNYIRLIKKINEQY